MFEGVFVVRGRTEKGDMIGEKWKLELEEGVVDGVGGWVGFLRFRCLFQGWPFSRLAGIEGKRFLLNMGLFW